MRFILLTLICLLFSTLGIGQSNAEYEILTSKASLCHLQKKYKEAIELYKKAFALQLPDALNAYKAAGMYALDSNREEAYRYLRMALDKGWAEADWLAADPYFSYLENTDAAGWKAIVHDAYSKEREYEKELRLPSLRKKINLLTLKDQQLRYLRINYKNQINADSLDEAIAQSDRHNHDEAKLIIQQYGWPKISDIGKDGANNLWLIVQHSDQDILFQRQALDLMSKMLNGKDLNLENYAYLYDRVQCGLNYRQLYGTQVFWSAGGTATGFRPIINEDSVNERRKKLGLNLLEVYALTYGFSYRPVMQFQAKKSESEDQKQVRLLMDSAAWYQKHKIYKKVYDAYNSASDIQGGMDNKDNYTAALQCAIIGSTTNDQSFKDIAVDFLVLLYKRGAVQKDRLLRQKEFTVLQNDKRWQAIINGEPIL
ncbi:DUF6624 domain-containing protein [Chitinophagaceae bacterium LWZ2-11]